MRIPLGWKLSRSHRRRPGTDVNDWFGATAALVERIGSKNEAFTFATATDFAAVPVGEKAPAALLLTRLAKLKHIIDRMVARKEGGPRVPGMRKEDDQ